MSNSELVFHTATTQISNFANDIATFGFDQFGVPNNAKLLAIFVTDMNVKQGAQRTSPFSLSLCVNGRVRSEDSGITNEGFNKRTLSVCPIGDVVKESMIVAFGDPSDFRDCYLDLSKVDHPLFTICNYSHDSLVRLGNVSIRIDWLAANHN